MTTQEMNDALLAANERADYWRAIAEKRMELLKQSMENTDRALALLKAKNDAESLRWAVQS